MYPKVDKKLGVLFPATQEITKAIGRQGKARIILIGIHALNKLGLPSQVPMKVVYLPDGAAKTVSVGKRNLAFKKSSPNNLLITGELSGLAIQAVNTIGQRKIDEKTLEKIQGILKQEKRADILNNAKLSPAWINKLEMQVL